MRNTKSPSPAWQAVCTRCGTVAGEGRTIAELATHGVCPGCGAPTEPRKRKCERRRHHGGLTRKKYLDPKTLLSFRKFMEQRAKDRGSRRAWTDYVIVEILSRTGMRAGELVQGEEHKGRFLRIRDVIIDESDPSIYVADGKGGVSRTIKIAPGLRDLLASYIAEFRKDCQPDAPLITGTTGNAMGYHVVNHYKCKIWAEEYETTGKTLGLETLTCHVFRHSFAVDWIKKNGHDYVALAEILGHSSPDVTMRIYCHTTSEDMRAAANRM